MQSYSTDKIEKIDFEDLIKDFRIVSVDELACYLKEIWKDLSQRNESQIKGIDKLTFSKVNKVIFKLKYFIKKFHGNFINK